MEFLITGTSGLYSFYSLYEFYNKRKLLYNDSWKTNKNILEIKEIENGKGISLNNYETKIDFPIYLNTGKNGFVGIPIGGSTHEELKEIYNKFYNDKMNIQNYEYLENRYDKEYFINTYDNLKNFLNNYDISESSFLIKLPIHVKETRNNKFYYTNFKTTLFNQNHYLICSNPNNLIKTATFRKRMPLSITSGCVFLGSLMYLYNDIKKSSRYY